jgi:hypothetical protein
MDEQHDGHGGELLGAGSEAEVGLRVDFGEGAEFAGAIAAFECCVAIFADENGEARGVCIGEGGENCVESWCYWVLRGSSGQRNVEEDKENREKAELDFSEHAAAPGAAYHQKSICFLPT